MRDNDIETRFEALRGARCPNYPLYTAFGRNDHGYDCGGPDGDGFNGDPPDDCEDWGDGAPGRYLLGDMLALWAGFWGRFDAEIAGAVFNLGADMIAAVAPDTVALASPATDSHEFANLVQLVSITRFQCDKVPDRGPHEWDAKPCTVAEIAALINVDEAAVKAAVEQHYWMFLGAERDGSPTIEHEGE